MHVQVTTLKKQNHPVHQMSNIFKMILHLRKDVTYIIDI